MVATVPLAKVLLFTLNLIPWPLPACNTALLPSYPTIPRLPFSPILTDVLVLSPINTDWPLAATCSCVDGLLVPIPTYPLLFTSRAFTTLEPFHPWTLSASMVDELLLVNIYAPKLLALFCFTCKAYVPVLLAVAFSTSRLVAGAVVPIPTRPLVVSTSSTAVLDAFCTWKPVVELEVV